MSEKQVENAELTHELLDWDVLKDFDAKKPRMNDDNLRDAEEIGQESRKKRGNIGRRALGVVEKFAHRKEMSKAQETAEAPMEAEAEPEEEENDRLALGNYEVVVSRAVQVLGQESFQGLVKELDVASGEKTPDETMEKFRAEAGAVRMDAADLWDAVLMQAKTEKYGEVQKEIKFYYKTDIEGLGRILDAGEIVRQDGGANLLASDVKMGSDYKDDEEWKSGYQRVKSGEVTMILDGSILDEASFVALGENPVVGKVDLRKSCLGVITEERDFEGKPITRILKEHGARWLPVYEFRQETEADWENTAFAADMLREVREEWINKDQERKRKQAEVFDEIDHLRAMRIVRSYAKRITLEDANKIVRRNVTLETKEARDRADETLAKYFAEILDLEYVPAVEYVYDPGSTRFGAMHRDKETGLPRAVELNRARVDGADLRTTISVLSHEMWHAKQAEIEVQWRNRDQNAAASAEGGMERGELYGYNRRNYVRPEVDIVKYKEQLLEVEARYFSDMCLERFDKSVRDSQKPMEMLKRKWAGWRREHFYQGKHIKV